MEKVFPDIVTATSFGSREGIRTMPNYFFEQMTHSSNGADLARNFRRLNLPLLTFPPGPRSKWSGASWPQDQSLTSPQSSGSQWEAPSHTELGLIDDCSGLHFTFKHVWLTWCTHLWISFCLTEVTLTMLCTFIQQHNFEQHNDAAT